MWISRLVIYISMSYAFITCLYSQSDIIEWNELSVDDENLSALFEQYEELSEIAENPFNFNTLTKEQLEQLPFLSDKMIENILYYVYKYGPVVSKNELLGVEGMDWQTRKFLEHFIYIGPAKDEEEKFSFKRMMQILGKSIKAVGMTTVTVCAIVGLAKVMVYAGMTDALAVALVSLLGPVYPLFAPLIGALGTFLTGSATSANVLFGNLQLSAATDLGVNKYWVVASNMTGATAGMLSPQNIAVATGAIHREGDEGEILKETVKWGSLYLVVCCVFLYITGLLTGMI